MKIVVNRLIFKISHHVFIHIMDILHTKPSNNTEMGASRKATLDPMIDMCTFFRVWDFKVFACGFLPRFQAIRRVFSASGRLYKLPETVSQAPFATFPGAELAFKVYNRTASNQKVWDVSSFRLLAL